MRSFCAVLYVRACVCIHLCSAGETICWIGNAAFRQAVYGASSLPPTASTLIGQRLDNITGSVEDLMNALTQQLPEATNDFVGTARLCWINFLVQTVFLTTVYLFSLNSACKPNPTTAWQRQRCVPSTHHQHQYPRNRCEPVGQRAQFCGDTATDHQQCQPQRYSGGY